VTPEYLDGPSFIEFLESEGVDLSVQPESRLRRIYDWRMGGRASIYGAAGHILTEECISERLIPDRCWSSEQKRYSKPRLTREQERERREDGMLMLANGMTVAEIARELGVTRRIVRNWRGQAKVSTAKWHDGLKYKPEQKVWVRA
jgi:hypothetical protein